MSLPRNTGPRLAARALIVEHEALLLVNAYPGDTSDLWCAPGGGVEKHQSIPDNLIREVREETGLRIALGQLAGINEFHDPTSDFHQVELFFLATIEAGELDDAWMDADGVVNQRRFFTRQQMNDIRYKPDSLAAFAFENAPARYDGLELIVR